jgi:hypothetical protein
MNVLENVRCRDVETSRCPKIARAEKRTARMVSAVACCCWECDCIFKRQYGRFMVTLNQNGLHKLETRRGDDK